MAQSSPMNGGDDTYSYTKNSAMQRNAAGAVMEAVKSALIENLDVEKLLSGSTTFAIADLGCSVGPNTFFAMQTLIETVEKIHGSKKLEFQVFFNDQTANDFNTLFASLPNKRNYFAAGVPGSFHGRLFPSSSIHIAYSSYAMHWLSKLPEELVVRDSPAWNGGKIHYMGASDAVVKAYADRFERDMEVILRARGEEISPGGVVVIMIPVVPDEDLAHGLGAISLFFESIFIDMVKEGVLEQDQVDSFNVATVHPRIKDMKRVIDKVGCFEIVKLDLMNIKPSKGDSEADPVSLLMQIRAVSEGNITGHFGKEIADKIFSTALEKKLEFTSFMHSIEAALQLCIVLKRKYY